MCGRFTLTTDAETLEQEFGVQSDSSGLVASGMPARFNIAPTQPVAVVVNRDGVREFDAFRWGLIPSWAKDMKIGNRMINARGETVAEKPSFKRPLKSRRCLVLADGFYEWQKTPDGKVPTYIHLEDHRPFALAGLWDRWESSEGDEVLSCTVITTEPNTVMAPIHNRMPVILPPDAIDIWLDPAQKSPDTLVPLLKPFPPELMQTYAVSRLVNSPGNDVPDCIRPA